MPKALLIAFIPALASGILKQLYEFGFLGEALILMESQAWSGFSFLVGFLVVFKSSHSFSRFWEGSTAAYRMRAHWVNVCSSIMAFTKASKCTPDMSHRFTELLVRLTSMLHASALAELERGNDSDGYVWADEYSIIDPQSIDVESLQTFVDSKHRVELLAAWIQQLIVENMSTGVLTIAPPILGRSFSELAAGVAEFENARKIACISIPFPYAQTTEWLLIVHTMIVPAITCQWVTNYKWAFLFTLIQVIVLWSLNLVAIELENPFGTDANDLDMRHMQHELNGHLKMFLLPTTKRTPHLAQSFDECGTTERNSTFEAVYCSLTVEHGTSPPAMARPTLARVLADASKAARLFLQVPTQDRAPSEHSSQASHRDRADSVMAALSRGRERSEPKNISPVCSKCGCGSGNVNVDADNERGEAVCSSCKVLSQAVSQDAAGTDAGRGDVLDKGTPSSFEPAAVLTL